MRGTPARVLGSVAIGAVVAATAACIPGLGNADAKAACNAMKTELKGIGGKAQSKLTDPTAAAQVYADAATKIRSEGAKAGGDVQPAANQVASDLDSLAEVLRQAAAGNVESPETSALIKDGAKLQTACNT
jgi:hypothetical protein